MLIFSRFYGSEACNDALRSASRGIIVLNLLVESMPDRLIDYRARDRCAKLKITIGTKVNCLKNIRYFSALNIRAIYSAYGSS